MLLIDFFPFFRRLEDDIFAVVDHLIFGYQIISAQHLGIFGKGTLRDSQPFRNADHTVVVRFMLNDIFQYLTFLKGEKNILSILMFGIDIAGAGVSMENQRFHQGMVPPHPVGHKKYLLWKIVWWQDRAPCLQRPKAQHSHLRHVKRLYCPKNQTKSGNGKTSFPFWLYCTIVLETLP